MKINQTTTVPYKTELLGLPATKHGVVPLIFAAFCLILLTIVLVGLNRVNLGLGQSTITSTTSKSLSSQKHDLYVKLS